MKVILRDVFDGHAIRPGEKKPRKDLIRPPDPLRPAGQVPCLDVSVGFAGEVLDRQNKDTLTRCNPAVRFIEGGCKQFEKVRVTEKVMEVEPAHGIKECAETPCWVQVFEQLTLLMIFERHKTSDLRLFAKEVLDEPDPGVPPFTGAARKKNACRVGVAQPVEDVMDFAVANPRDFIKGIHNDGRVALRWAPSAGTNARHPKPSCHAVEELRLSASGLGNDNHDPEAVEHLRLWDTLATNF
ncbi:MAG: hypothetical protein AAF318_17835 [Pseudomonadota bacterium]